MNRSRYLIKNVGILTISNFSSRILVFLLVPLYTSVLSTTDVGVYDLIVSTVSLLLPILTLNISDAVMRFLMDNTQSKADVAWIGMRWVLGGILCAAICIMLAVHIPFLHNSVHGFEIYIFLYYVFSSLNQYFIQFAKGLELVAAMGIAGIIGSVAILALNIIFLLVLKWGLPGFFIAAIAGQALSVFYLVIKTKIWGYLKEAHFSKQLQWEMLVYCTPLIATVLGWWVNGAADKYVVAIMCGVAANGILSVSYKIPAIINTLQVIFIQAWQISAIKEYGGKDTAVFYGRTFVALNTMMSIACAGLIFLAQPIGHILYQKGFYVAWKYVPFLLIASVLNSASGFLGPILSAQKNSKSMALASVYGATANIIFNIALVYIMGIQGATIATVIASYIIYRVRKIAVGNAIIINNYIVIGLTWGFLILQGIIEIYTSMWWMEIILMAAILYLNKNSMQEICYIAKKLIPKMEK